MRLPESAKPQTLARRALQGLLPLPGERGIEVGSGKGEFPDIARQWWKLLPSMARCEVREWDKDDGDAHELRGVADASMDWLFSSHCLEHLEHPNLALQNWLRVVRPGGYLLISVPHRQLYERRQAPPSRWNHDHKWFFLPYEDDGHRTVGLWRWLAPFQAPWNFDVVLIATGDWGHTNTGQGEHEHPNGEYCIDVLLRRR